MAKEQVDSLETELNSFMPELPAEFDKKRSSVVKENT